MFYSMEWKLANNFLNFLSTALGEENIVIFKKSFITSKHKEKIHYKNKVKQLHGK